VSLTSAQQLVMLIKRAFHLIIQNRKTRFEFNLFEFQI
jgi:hypothetical protein